jgi:heme-degrading monooxygenase HmoA
METEAAHRYLAMATYLPLKRFSSTIRFFRAVFAVRNQLASADGLVGYSMRAKPLRREYWTVSVWRDQEALRAFVRTAPHLEVMSSLRSTMGPTKFAQWEITAEEGRPSWTSALDRLASS